MIRNRRGIASLVLIVASAAGASAQNEPPPGLVRRIAEREAACLAERNHYTYRQSVVIDEIEPRGGQYRETREVIFTPSGERVEQMVGKPSLGLQRLHLTPEDFEDIRDIQPLLLVPELLPRYEVRFRGDENLDGLDCWVLEITPRQIFHGFRMFDGLIWADKKTFSVVRTHGKAVPSLRTSKSENLFPRFTTIREKVDGECRFPVYTHADDVLDFRTGPLRMRLIIRFMNYKRFGAESKITFDPPQ